MANTINEMTDLCCDADMHDQRSWDGNRKSYRCAEDSAEAKVLFDRILACREALEDPVLAAVRNEHEGHLLTVPEPDGGPLSSGRYRPHTWLDMHYSVDQDGDPLQFEKYKGPGVRPNTFRLWFTSAGVGLGIFPTPSSKTEHPGRLSLFSASLPARFIDREPSASGWDNHPLGLAGINGRKHIYLADWRVQFENDDNFLSVVADCWLILGETLNTNRV